ncbi:hypothetical protein PENTCL1PPCAC_12064, partial [Pristionchus entomophagus]
QPLKCQNYEQVVNGGTTEPRGTATSVACANDEICVLSVKREGTVVTVYQNCDKLIGAVDQCILSPERAVLCGCKEMNCNQPSVFVLRTARMQSLLEELMTIGVSFDLPNSFSLAVSAMTTTQPIDNHSGSSVIATTRSGPEPAAVTEKPGSEDRSSSSQDGDSSNNQSISSSLLT